MTTEMICCRDLTNATKELTRGRTEGALAPAPALGGENVFVLIFNVNKNYAKT